VNTHHHGQGEGAPLVPYGQGRARGLGADELGVHGDEMDRLVALGLPVVPGLTVPASRAAELTDPAVARHAVDLMQELVGRAVGAAAHPMLLRLSASAPVAASGLPPEVPALGVSWENAPALAALIGRDADLYAAWAGVIRFLAQGPLELSPDDLDDAVAGVLGPQDQVRVLLELCEQKGLRPFPSDPAEQLALAAAAVLQRWASPRGKRARRTQSLPEDLGLALHVQALRIGPWERSGYGSAVSRNLETGVQQPQGVFYAGMRRSAPRPADSGQPLSALPGGADLLAQTLTTLEHHLHGVAQVEFELRDGKLSLLSASQLERPTPMASIRLAVDLASAGSIDTAEAVGRISPKAVQELLHARLQLTGDEQLLVTGLAASPGAAQGRVALSSRRALELSSAGVSVVLLSTETTPGDVPALLAADAVVTTAGGLASHAAVVARGAGLPAVCGAADLRIDLARGTVQAGGTVVREGEMVTVDGRTGNVYVGELDIRAADPPVELERLLGWADEHRRMGVRTNADTVRETVAALRLGAEGIGLCRTEHQFLGDRLPVVRRFLLAKDEAEHLDALQELTDAQREDFRDLLRAAGDRPVTVRLLDAPLHEFLPHDGAYEDESQAARAMEMREVNPMLGVRGVRLALLNEDLYPAQAEALFSAWVDVVAEGVRPQLEVMIPLVSLPEELELAIEQVHGAAATVLARTGVAVPYLVGSMVETPRGALLAGRLAEVAQFLSFGTNDLTQMTYGFSRDDVESRLLKKYVERGLLSASPFAELDPDGVLALIAVAVERARAVRPDIKLGVCGEHGGDATSIFRLEPLGLDYVSCSPQRVPIARLAAAQATLGLAAKA